MNRYYDENEKRKRMKREKIYGRMQYKNSDNNIFEKKISCLFSSSSSSLLLLNFKIFYPYWINKSNLKTTKSFFFFKFCHNSLSFEIYLRTKQWRKNHYFLLMKYETTTMTTTLTTKIWMKYFFDDNRPISQLIQIHTKKKKRDKSKMQNMHFYYY